MIKHRVTYKSKDLYKRLLAIIIPLSILFIIFFYLNIKTPTEYLYDFEDDTINSFPIGFVGVGRNTTNIKVVEWDLNDGHEGKVVQISYLNENDYGGVELNTLFDKANKGFISFDIYLKHDLPVKIDICQEDPIYDARDDITLRFPNSDGYIAIQDESGSQKIILSPTLKLLEWYHFEIEFNCQQNEWDANIYKETRLIGSGNFNFFVPPPYMCQLYFATYAIDNKFYIDNVYISLDN